MRNAIIENGVVVNVIVGEIEGSIACPDDVGPDWLWDGESFTPPIKPLPPLADAKAALWDAVKRRRDAASALITYDGHTYQADLESRTNLAGAQDLVASGSVSEISWTTADNVEVIHDAASLAALWLAGAAQIAACHTRSKALRVEIDAAPDHAVLDAIDIEAGWPDASAG